MPCRRRSGVRIWRLITLLTFVFLTIGSQARELTPHQERGRQLFFKGSDDGEKTPNAQIGPGSTIVPATVVPCANCHGEDGHGGVEGVIEAPDISWRSLSNPIGNVRQNYRISAKYTEENFSLAVSQGVDPSGSRLNTIMPRYSYTHEQLEALTDYLKIIEIDQSPGVTDDNLRIGILLPEKSAFQVDSVSVLSIFHGLFDVVNREGGIYGRRIDVEHVISSKISDGSISELRPEYFALLDPYFISSRKDAQTIKRRIPLIAAAPAMLDDGSALQKHEFYLFGGLKENIEVLLTYLMTVPQGRHSHIAVLSLKDAMSVDISDFIARTFTAFGLPRPIYASYGAEDRDFSKITERFRSLAVTAVIYLGERHAFYDLLGVVQAQSWSPWFLLPTPVIDERAFNLPQSFAERLIMAYPINPEDQTHEIDFRTLRKNLISGAGNIASERMAYGLSQVMIAGLKGAGRELSITRFVAALEHLKNLETGVSRPLSFGPDRRIGVPGAYIFGVDATAGRLTLRSEWLGAGDFFGGREK